MQSSPDGDLIGVCQQEERCLVTLDLDFASPLQYPPQNHHGIVVLRFHGRISTSAIDLLIRTMTKALEEERLIGKLWIVEPGRVRVHTG